MKLFALGILVLSLLPLSSAVVDLSGQSGKDTLAGIQTGSGLWNWGSAPLGHVVDNSQLISAVRREPMDITLIETPLQAQGIDSGEWIATAFAGFDELSSYQIPHGSGVFDASMFHAPTEAEFPREY